MKSENRRFRWLLLVLTSLIIIFIILRLRNQVRHVAVYPQEDGEISVFGRIGVTLNQPMNIDSVKEHFSILPEVKGDMISEGNSIWFIPNDKLNPDQVYRVSIDPGAQGSSGRKLRKPIVWEVKVREPDLLYLVVAYTGGDLWLYDTTTGETQPLTHTQGELIDFMPSPTGDQIAYAKHNSAGGSDIWRIDRDGRYPQILLNCGMDRCSEIAWSPDGIWIAYARESFDHDLERYLPARVWTINSQTGETTPIYQRTEAYGHSPSFSPDGKRLATYDSVQNAIRILKLETSQESAIPSVYPDVGNWSPNGEEMIFVDLVPGVLEPNVGLFIVNFVDKEIRDAFGDFIPGMDFDPPQWSPDGDWIAFAARPVNTAAGKGLWIENLDRSEKIPLTEDPAGSFSGYRWDPWGEQLVFQRYPISGPMFSTSLWVWDHSTGESRLLIDQGARPEWLP
jgi:Tol biopolymer transport system component